MNKHSSLAATGSLLERAAEKFDFAGALRGLAVEQPEFAVETELNDATPAPPRKSGGRRGEIDRVAMSERGFVLPDQRPDVLAEEFRIVKRQLLLRAAGKGCEPIENGRLILVCSANPNEGKTFCSINLALSMARETDLDVVLADGDFSKPAIL
jgi:receptor protein-tyrosine kinase